MFVVIVFILVAVHFTGGLLSIRGLKQIKGFWSKRLIIGTESELESVLDIVHEGLVPGPADPDTDREVVSVEARDDQEQDLGREI